MKYDTALRWVYSRRYFAIGFFSSDFSWRPTFGHHTVSWLGVYLRVGPV